MSFLFICLPYTYPWYLPIFSEMFASHSPCSQYTTLSPHNGGWVGGGYSVVHGRSRMPIDPRILAVPGRSTSSFHQPGGHCLNQARSAVTCSASRMKSELHLFKNRSRNGLRRLVPAFLFMDDSANELLVFLCGHSRDRNGYYCVTASWVPYHIRTTWCDHCPCAELGCSTPYNMIYSTIL